MNDTFGKQKDQFTNHHEILALYTMANIKSWLTLYNITLKNQKKSAVHFNVALGIGGLYMYLYMYWII